MINDIFRSFFRTIGRILAYIAIGLVIAYFSGIVKPANVKAVENTSLGLTIGDGTFYSLSAYPSWQDIGFQLPNYVSAGSLWSAIPTDTAHSYGLNGGALSQCGMSFVKDFYYSVSYNFLISSYLNYLHPWYSSWSSEHTINVCNSKSCTPTYSHTSVSSGMELVEYDSSYSIGSFTIIFKAPSTGSCVSIAFSSYNNSTNVQLSMFVGYSYQSLGSSSLSESDIQSALSSDFNNLSNKIEDMKSEQEKTNSKLDSTNSKLDETNKTLTSEDDDTTSSSCGIVCKLKGIFTSITELPKKIVDFMIDGLKSLFIPENTDFITDFVDSLEDKLGLIAEVPIAIIEFGLDLVNSSWESVTSISLPSIEIFGYNFWNAQEIDISQGLAIFQPYKYITDCICVLICCRTLVKWRENFSGGGS